MTLEQRLHDVAAPHVGPSEIPGMVALVTIGDEVATVALGNLDLDNTRPVQRDSLFRIASTSKPITGAATMALVGEGLIDLDEPIDRLLPEMAGRQVLRAIDGPLDDTVPAQRKITTRDLLTFTFGFGMCLEMFMAREPWPILKADKEFHLSSINPPELHLMPDPDTWIERLGSLPLLAQPGERWLYQTGAQVVSVLLARAAGQPFADVLKTRLFEPLKMRDTNFYTTDTDRLATAYMTVPDGTEGLVAWDPPDGFWSAAPPFPDGGAGLVSTADDLLAFGRMLLDKGRAPDGTQLVPEDAVKEMCTGQLTPAQIARGGLGPSFFDGMNWGFLQAVRDDGSYGWAGGFGSTYLVDPASDRVVIVLTQRNFDSSGPHPLHDAIQTAATAD
ncbi:MAG: serine hydrolase domain-containing protein [Solirubrobacteraceae bacterium]